MYIAYYLVVLWVGNYSVLVALYLLTTFCYLQFIGHVKWRMRLGRSGLLSRMASTITTLLECRNWLFIQCTATTFDSRKAVLSGPRYISLTTLGSS